MLVLDDLLVSLLPLIADWLTTWGFTILHWLEFGFEKRNVLRFSVTFCEVKVKGERQADSLFCWLSHNAFMCCSNREV